MKNGNPAYQDIHKDLIDDCRRRDRKAQFQIYKLYYKSMYNVSLRIVNDTMEAEDIMQESFLSAFESIDKFSGKVSFGAWLKRIVINRSLDAIKQRKFNFISIEEEPILPEAAEEEPEGEITGFKLDMIHRCIKDLPDGYRVILSLYLLEGYDHEEIAEILNISSSTSRSQYTRARQKLYEMLTN